MRVRRGPATGAQPRPPSSKYYTLRYVLAAFLAEGESLVRAPAASDDTEVLVGAIRALGARAEWMSEMETAAREATMPGVARGGGAGSPVGASNPRAALRVVGCGGRLRAPASGVVNVGNAGAVLRLLLGLGALLPEVRFETPYPLSLGRRPNADLLAALGELGIACEAGEPGGLLPITLRGGPPRGGSVSISGANSSQYLSALLYLAPLTAEGLRISVTDGLRSAPLVRATLRALARAGVAVEAAPDLRGFVVAGGQRYRAGTHTVPGDGPSAAALVGAAVALGAPLRLERLDRAEADVEALLAALAGMGIPLNSEDAERDELAPVGGVRGHAQADAGVDVDAEANGGEGPALMLAPGARPHGARIDGDACTDSVPALVALACFADGESRFEGVATLRLKESDRIGDLCAELGRAGCDLEAEADAIVVRGRPEGIVGGVTVAGHQDHRLVQALAIAALHSREGLVISDARHVAKSYPGFFADLAAMGAVVEAVEDDG
jgi:3-phosphoshikimate 1-carboxyvinyltransferase